MDSKWTGIASRILLLLAIGPIARAAEAPLADAAERSDRAAVRALLECRIDVNQAQVDGMTGLHWAAYRDDLEMAKLLVDSKANAKSENRYGVTPLSLACTNGNAAMVELLLDAGADPHTKLRGNETVLMTAARTGRVGPVKALLSRGADVNTKEWHGQTALMWAAAEGHAEVVEALVRAGADFRTSLPSGFTALFFAVREGRTDVVRVLLKAGADVNEAMAPKKRPSGKAPRRGTTPLILAVENGHFELAVTLLEAGADPNDQRSGFTALHTLTWVRKPNRGDGDDGDPAPIGSGSLSSLQLVEKLVEHGADVNARLRRGASGRGVLSRVGATPFLLAAMTADVPLMRALLRHGADPKLSNAHHCTPLMAAAGVGCLAPGEEAGTEPEALEAVALAIELGNDVNAVNDNGETAMHGAAYKNFPKVVQLLADRGAKVEVWNRKNKYGWTPLSIAEGHRVGNFKPSPETIAALRRMMGAAVVPPPSAEREGVASDGEGGPRGDRRPRAAAGSRRSPASTDGRRPPGAGDSPRAGLDPGEPPMIRSQDTVREARRKVRHDFIGSIGMSWRRAPGEPVDRASPPADSTGADAPRGRPRCALPGLLLVLGLVLAAYRVRSDRIRSPERGSAGGTTPTELAAPIDPPHDLAPVRANPTVPVPRSPFKFNEIAREAGITFVHTSGTTEAKQFPTASVSGVAMFDADHDGKLDLYFATATRLPVGTARSGPNRLYRNLGGNRFRDATEESGLGFAGFCQGIVVGDIDNDGDQDVYLCNYGGNVLYRNEGDGRFRDVSKAAGVDFSGWSTSGAFLDYDNDGDLDLYVANYGRWKLPDDDQFCGGPKLAGMPGPDRARVYCSPRLIRPARHILYRNDGDGTFTDVTEAAGVGRADGRGLGVVAADLNGDGRVNLYVANDTCPNFVYFNRGDGTFEDATDSSGAGYDASGHVRAGMGVNAEDVNGDGLIDLFVTNYFDEPNSLFIGRGAGAFVEPDPDVGPDARQPPLGRLGLRLADFDNDGWPDCFVANGHVNDNLHLFGIDSPYAQPALLHRNQGNGRFRLATRDAGAYFDADHVSRGVAYGDIDDDGDIDLVVNHKDREPALLRNDTEPRGHWIRLRLVGTRSNRDGIGAVVEVEVGGRTIVRQRKGGTSFASAHDPRLLIGLADASTARAVTVRWPSGHVNRRLGVRAGTDLLIREADDAPAPLDVGENPARPPDRSS